MAIDIFDVKPHAVSRNLKGYTVFLYGDPKTGKTTTASHFENSLLLAFEMGYLAIPGIRALPMNSWSDFRKVIKQLKKEEAHQMYDNIIVDTVDIAYDLCEKYICEREGVETIGDVPYGGGWGMLKKEYDECLRAIPQMGYGLVPISHSQDKQFKDEEGHEYNKIVPTLGNAPRLIVERMSDIIIYAKQHTDDAGNTSVIGYLRGTTRFEAGSRFKYITDKIEFNYKNLVNAIGDAIDKEAEEYSGEFIDETNSNQRIVKKLDFDELMAEFNECIKSMQEKAGSAFGTMFAPKIVSITETYLGKGNKVSEMSRSQVEQLDLIVDDLKDLLNEA